MFELTVIYPNSDLETYYASERCILEQQILDMDGLGCLFYIEEVDPRIGPRNRRVTLPAIGGPF